MKVVFVDPIPWDYNVASVDARPLGGAQSAACYLARDLAHRGHHVQFVSHALRSEVSYNVECIAWHSHGNEAVRHLQADVVIAVFSTDAVLDLRRQFANVPFVLWIPHAHDDPALGNLRNQSLDLAADAFVLVSDWQAQQFRNTYAMPEEKMIVLRNAVAPVFESSLSVESPIFKQKGSAPILAFTSTPFRGLQALLSIFPAVREQIPGVRLQVYSSMQVYQMPDAQEQQQFGRLYGYARRMTGVEYKGSISQPALAQALRHVSLLAYPSVFPETSCIAVMEAMAAGCQIVTSDLGALPETTAGFATLVPMRAKTFLKEFVRAIVEQLQRRPEESVDMRLQEQIGWVRRHYTWANRAKEWEAFLLQLIGGGHFSTTQSQARINHNRVDLGRSGSAPSIAVKEGLS